MLGMAWNAAAHCLALCHEALLRAASCLSMVTRRSDRSYPRLGCLTGHLSDPSLTQKCIPQAHFQHEVSLHPWQVSATLPHYDCLGQE